MAKKVVKKSKGKTAGKGKPKGEKMVATNVRFEYSRTFAKALGRDGSGKGKARRNDVKEWARTALQKAMDALVAGEATEPDDDTDEDDDEDDE